MSEPQPPITPAMAAWLRDKDVELPISPRLPARLCVLDHVWSMIEELETNRPPKNVELLRVYRGLRHIAERDPDGVEPVAEAYQACALIADARSALARWQRQAVPTKARQELAALRRREARAWLFPASKGDGHYIGLQKVWAKIRAAAGLTDVHLHDLRHTVGAAAASSGTSLVIVGRMLGHKKARSTERYAHVAPDAAADAADKVTARLMGAFSR